MNIADTAVLAASVGLSCIWRRELIAIGEFIGWQIGRAFLGTLNIDIGDYHGEN